MSDFGNFEINIDLPGDEGETKGKDSKKELQPKDKDTINKKPEESKQDDGKDKKETEEKKQKGKSGKSNKRKIVDIEDDSEPTKESIEEEKIKELDERIGQKIDVGGRCAFILDPKIKELEGAINVIVDDCDAKEIEQHKKLFKESLRRFERNYSSYQQRNIQYRFRIYLNNADIIYRFLNSNMEVLKIKEHARGKEILEALEELNDLIFLAKEKDREKIEKMNIGNVRFV